MTSMTPPIDADTTAAPYWRRWVVFRGSSNPTMVVIIDNKDVNTALPANTIQQGAAITTQQRIVDA